MKFSFKKTQDFNFQLPPPGTHLAVCYLVAELGKQNTPYGVKHQWRVGFELPNELMDDGRPLSTRLDINKTWNEEGKMYKFVSAMLGTDFEGTQEFLDNLDLSQIIGKGCLLQIEIVTSKKGREYAKIASFQPVMRGQVVPPLVNDPILFGLDDHTQEDFDALPEYLQQLVNRSGDDPSETDDVPF